MKRKRKRKKVTRLHLFHVPPVNSHIYNIFSMEWMFFCPFSRSKCYNLQNMPLFCPRNFHPSRRWKESARVKHSQSTTLSCELYLSLLQPARYIFYFFLLFISSPLVDRCALLLCWFECDSISRHPPNNVLVSKVHFAPGLFMCTMCWLNMNDVQH